MHQRDFDSVGGGVQWKIFHTLFDEVVSFENLLTAWREFRRGKRNKLDVQDFEFYLEDNLFALHQELEENTYLPNPYEAFYVNDPKLRHIHKATVRDRVVHQALFRILYPIFEKSFIFDSYSCRIGKGTHRAVDRLEAFIRKASENTTKPVFALKCDIRKFFDSIDHSILSALICRKIEDEGMLWLVHKIICSFEKEKRKGLPLGNVTSQLFANIYLDELDQFVKHILKVKYYIRYCDDFVILGSDREHLVGLAARIREFLKVKLELTLHEGKIIIRKYSHGVDFLGYIVLPHYRVLRTKTKRRLLRKIKEKKLAVARGLLEQTAFDQSVQSYFGVLKHCRGFKLRKRIFGIISS